MSQEDGLTLVHNMTHTMRVPPQQEIVSCVGNSPLDVTQTQQWPDKEVT